MICFEQKIALHSQYILCYIQPLSNEQSNKSILLVRSKPFKPIRLNVASQFASVVSSIGIVTATFIVCVAAACSTAGSQILFPYVGIFGSISKGSVLLILFPDFLNTLVNICVVPALLSSVFK